MELDEKIGDLHWLISDREALLGQEMERRVYDQLIFFVNFRTNNAGVRAAFSLPETQRNPGLSSSLDAVVCV